MTDMFWPGDHRAGTVMSDEAFLAALVDVENAWLAVLVEHGVAPASAAADVTALVARTDATTIAAGAGRTAAPSPASSLSCGPAQPARPHDGCTAV